MSNITKVLFSIIVIILVLYVVYVLYRYFIKMDISKRGLDFIKFHEGVRYKMYYDTEGYPTIGIGHLIKPEEEWMKTATLTEKQVDDLFKKDIQSFVDAANKGILVPVQQHTFDAVVSILFNIGKGWAGFGGHKKASFVEAINALKTDNDYLSRQVMKFRYPSVITGRRAKEARLMTKGDYSVKMSDQEVLNYLNL